MSADHSTVIPRSAGLNARNGSTQIIFELIWKYIEKQNGFVAAKILKSLEYQSQFTFLINILPC